MQDIVPPGDTSALDKAIQQLWRNCIAAVYEKIEVVARVRRARSNDDNDEDEDDEDEDEDDEDEDDQDEDEEEEEADDEEEEEEEDDEERRNNSLLGADLVLDWHRFRRELSCGIQTTAYDRYELWYGPQKRPIYIHS